MGTELFIAAGVFPVELLANQVLMVCAENWPRYNLALIIYILDIILG